MLDFMFQDILRIRFVKNVERILRTSCTSKVLFSFCSFVSISILITLVLVMRMSVMIMTMDGFFEGFRGRNFLDRLSSSKGRFTLVVLWATWVNRPMANVPAATALVILMTRPNIL
jgi:hypothetical protein